MSLEDEAWKTDGRPVTSRPERAPTAGDVVARAAAVLILLVFATFSIWVFSLLLPSRAARAVSIILLGIGLLVVVALLFKTRELRRKLAQAHAELAGERREREAVASAPSPTETTNPPPNP